MAAKPSTLTLNTGHHMPLIGLGTWKIQPEEVGEVVEAGIDAGLRHLDCAYGYGNEKEIGEAIAAKIQDGTITRSDLFVTSKLWNTFHEPHRVREGFDVTLKLLDLQYLDLYLIHWPISFVYTGDYNNIFPQDAEGRANCTEVDYLDTYREMEKLVEEGQVRAIGLSNFNIRQIQRVLDNCTIKPAVLQVEVHPLHTNTKLVEFAQSKGIAVTAFSPFASPDRDWAQPTDPNLLNNKTIGAIAGKLSKSPAQVALRYLLQRNIIAVPRSRSIEHIKNNLNIFDFELSEEDMATLNSLNIPFRSHAASLWKHSKLYPFNED